MKKIDPTGLALVRMRAALLDLAEWAEARINDENANYDRQYIAEHLAESARALALDTDAPDAPF